LYGKSFGRLLMVADGMGGHQAGSRASLLAIDLLINQMVNGMRWPTRISAEEEDRFVLDLKQLFETAHKMIVRESETHLDMRGMGTTLSMSYIIWPLMYVVHVGDSRCYLIRDGVAKQLTRDHTLSSQLAEKSGMTAEQAENSHWSHILYNALGAGGSEVTVEVQRVTLQQEDVVFLCTDGLYRHVKAVEIADLFIRELELDETCRSLIELANFRGGQDNITVVAARCLRAKSGERPRTVVAAEMTLERALGDLHGYHPDITEELNAETEDFPAPTEENPRQTEEKPAQTQGVAVPMGRTSGGKTV
jgi:protein phosphatase